MVNNTESRRERKKASVRNRIIATAIELFGKHGMEQVTVEHIADVADLGKGTLYNYFQTKEDIVVAYMVEKEEAVQASLAELANSRGSLADVLTDYVRQEFRMKRKYHGFVRVFLAQMFARTDQFMPYMVKMQESINHNLSTLFARLDERGLLRKDIAMSDLIMIFKTIQLGLTALWAIEGPPYQMTNQLVEQKIRLFCEGLEKKRS
jgi:AcrR family transcriptional regulator